MIVLVCGMLRSGSTLHYQIAVALADAASPNEPTHAGGWDWPSLRSDAAKPNTPLHIVKVHDPNPAIESSLDPEHVSYIYSYRDLRDVAVSYYDLRASGRDLPAAQALDWLPAALHAYAHFTTFPPAHRLLISRYESAVRDLTSTVLATRDFLGLEVSSESCARIAADLTLERQRRRIADVSWSDNKQWDPHSLLHKNHLNDARTHKWLHQLPPEHVHHIETVAAQWLTDHDYPLSTHAHAA